MVNTRSISSSSKNNGNKGLVGAQKRGTGNRLAHGLWTIFEKTKIDGRTKLGRAIRSLKRDLTEHCGGEAEVSIAERILIDQVVSRTVRRRMYEAGIFRAENQGSRDHFLALEEGLRRDLIALGLKAKKVREMLNLSEYLEQKEGNEDGNDH